MPGMLASFCDPGVGVLNIDWHNRWLPRTQWPVSITKRVPWEEKQLARSYCRVHVHAHIPQHKSTHKCIVCLKHMLIKTVYVPLYSCKNFYPELVLFIACIWLSNLIFEGSHFTYNEVAMFYLHFWNCF